MLGRAHRQRQAGLQFGGGDRPAPKNLGRLALDPQDGGLGALGAGAAVEHRRDPSAQARQDLLGGGRAEFLVGVGRRGRHGQAEALQQMQQHRVVGNPKPDRRQAAGNDGRNPRVFFQQQGERPRPEAIGHGVHPVRHVGGPARQLVGAGQVDDQRVVARALLGLEDAGDRPGVGRVGGQPVHGLGRHGHQLPGLQQARGPFLVGGVGRVQPLGFHGVHR